MDNLPESQLAYRVAELERKLVNVVRLCVVSEADYPNARVRVAFLAEAEGGEPWQSAWLPWLTQRASNDIDWWAPEVGEQVVVFSPAGNLKRGVVLPAIYQQAHDAPTDNPDVRIVNFADGATVEYNRKDSHLKAKTPGTAELETGGTVTAKVGGDFSGQIIGKSTFQVGGDLTATVGGNYTVTVNGNSTITSSGPVKIEAPSADIISGGKGVVTGDCVCHLTGLPHGDISSKVTAAK